jgi:ABC-type transport system substrate-binding protein
MSQRSKWLPLGALVAAAAIAFGACGGATSPSPSASASAPASQTPTEPPESEPPYDGMAYPEDGDAPCGDADYTGEFKKITAIDRLTVEFQLCNPDVAFLSKVAFSAFAIDDSDYLTANAASKVYLEEPNGTGPYKLKEWDHGNRLVLEAFDGYWGGAPKTPNVEFRWSDEAAQRWLELQAGSVDGIDNPGADDIDDIKANSDVTLYPREGLNTLYLGFNNTIEPWDDVNVRKAIALGLDRERLVDNFYPEGSEVATHFTPCAIPYGCEGEETWEFDAAAGKDLLTQAGFDFSKSYKIQFRAAVRGYAPDPPIIATEIANQLKANLGINVVPTLLESGAMTDGFAAGTLDGIIQFGWGADYPDITNFLDFHFGSGSGKKFGQPFPDIVEALNKGAQSADEAVRRASAEEANNLIKEHVPAVIVAHGGSGTVFKADVQGAHSSPLSTEIFSVMQAGDRDTLVWMQNAEPLGLYCGDETDGESLRACEQIKESLYAYKVAGTATEPSLATECTSNDDLTVWTCTLRDGVTFHDGAELDANDVVLSYAVQWDADHELHVGRSGAFEYFPGLFGGFLNPPPPSS